MPSKFGIKRRGRKAREEFTDTGLENITANRIAPRVRAQEPAGTRAKIKGIRQFAMRSHIGQAEQIRRGQDMQAEQEKQNLFNRNQAIQGREAQAKRDKFGQQQAIERGLRDDQRLKLEGRRVDISGRAEEARRTAQAQRTAQRTAKLQRPKAGVGAGVISKKPSATKGYYMGVFDRLAPFSEIDMAELDDEGNFKNQATRNRFLDALDVYAQRNPGANEEEAVRWAAQASGLDVPKSDQQQPSAPTQPGQATQQLIPTRPVPNVGAGQQQRERLISKPAPKAKTAFSRPKRTAEEEAQRIADRENRLTKKGLSSDVIGYGSLEDGTAVIRNKTLAEATSQMPEQGQVNNSIPGTGGGQAPIVAPQAIQRPEQSATPQVAAPQQPVQQSRQFARPAAVAPVLQQAPQQQDPLNRAINAGAGFSMARAGVPQPGRGAFSRALEGTGVTPTQLAGAAQATTAQGILSRGIDAYYDGPAIRERQTKLATLDNATGALRSGQVTGDAAGALRKTIIKANKLMQKEELNEVEQEQLDATLKILQERYSQ